MKQLLQMRKEKVVILRRMQQRSLEDITTQNKIYIIQLGVFQTYDNLLKLAGKIQQLGYNYGILKLDGQYSVFSHISGTKESLNFS